MACSPKVKKKKAKVLLIFWKIPKTHSRRLAPFFFFLFQRTSEGKVLIKYHAWMKFYCNFLHKSYVFYLKWVKNK